MYHLTLKHQYLIQPFPKCLHIITSLILRIHARDWTVEIWKGYNQTRCVKLLMYLLKRSIFIHFIVNIHLIYEYLQIFIYFYPNHNKMNY